MELADVIRQLYGEDVYITDKAEISGGDINDAYHLYLSNGENLFIKINANAKDDFFAAEKAGLEALHKAGAVTPSVIAYGKTKDNLSYLLLNYVRKSRNFKGLCEKNHGIIKNSVIFCLLSRFFSGILLLQRAKEACA